MRSERGSRGVQGEVQAAEAKIYLHRLSNNLKSSFNQNSAFPVGKVGPSPAQPCCKNAGGTCAVSADWGKDPVWVSVDFDPFDPHRFQYTYQSDGKTVVATAIGDLDCDGTTITYKLEMGVGNAGEPTAVFTDAKVSDD